MSTDGRTGHRQALLQIRADAALDELATSMFNVQRLLMALAAASASPQQLAADLTRYGELQGPDIYQQFSDLSQRFLSRSLLVASAYASECLRNMVPPHRRAEVGEPPAVPQPAGRADPSELAAWYARFGAWAAQQQAWSARVYQVLRDEVAAGRMSPDAARTSGQSFVQAGLPGYLSDMAEISMDLIAGGMSAADASVRGLSDALQQEPSARELTVEMHGRPGTMASTELAIENNRTDPAEVVCIATPMAGSRLAIEPARFHLAPGQTERVRIRLDLPDTPTDGSVPAGTISVAGSGDTTLLVHVRATAAAATRSITIRALEPVAEPAGVVAAGAR